jgi:hypothetical protein
MDYNDAHPSTLHADAHIERAAIIRLIKAHAADCERRGARSLGHGYLALVSEIEDAMQHDRAHVEALESPPVKVPPHVTGERLLDTCGECEGSGGYDGRCFICDGTGLVEG